MRLNKYFFLLGATALAFTACNNNDDGPEQGTKDRTVINLSLGSAQTRSLSESAANLFNNINTLDVYFYNTGGQYVEYPKSGTTEGGTVFDNVQAIQNAINDLKTKQSAQLKLLGIPNAASQIYIVANQPASTDFSIKSLEEVRNSIIRLRTQTTLNDDTDVDFTQIKRFSGENSTLTGLEQMTENINVDLTPVPTRIELRNITAKKDPAWQGVDIQSFTVKGIYVNGFYTWGTMKGEYTDMNDEQRKRVDNGETADNYTKAFYKSIVNSSTLPGVGSATGYAFLCDEPADADIAYTEGQTTDDFIRKATPKAFNGKDGWWGYQLLPGNAPHMVVKLGVTFADGTTGDRFLTIVSYKSGESSLLNFERGKVYRMENIEFTAGDLTEVPYEGDKTINANIRVLAWVPVAITPEFH